MKRHCQKTSLFLLSLSLLLPGLLSACGKEETKTLPSAETTAVESTVSATVATEPVNSQEKITLYKGRFLQAKPRLSYKIPLAETEKWKEGGSLVTFLSTLGVKELQEVAENYTTAAFPLTEEDVKDYEKLLLLPVYRAEGEMEVSSHSLNLAAGPQTQPLYTPWTTLSLMWKTLGEEDLVYLWNMEPRAPFSEGRTLAATLNEEGELVWGREDGEVDEEFSPVLNCWKIKGLSSWYDAWKSRLEQEGRWKDLSKISDEENLKACQEARPVRTERLEALPQIHYDLSLPREVIPWKADDSEGRVEPLQAMTNRQALRPWQEGDSLGRLLQVLDVTDLSVFLPQGKKEKPDMQEGDLYAMEELLALPVYSGDLVEQATERISLRRGENSEYISSPLVELKLEFNPTEGEKGSPTRLVLAEPKEGGYLGRQLVASIGSDGQPLWAKSTADEPDLPHGSFQGQGPLPVAEKSFSIPGLAAWYQKYSQ